jgi:hypothetical protein
MLTTPSFEIVRVSGSRDRDRRLQRIAVGSHDLALIVLLERTIARIGDGAVGQQVIWKKPLPSMARSSPLPVCCRLPCVKRRAVVTGCTPVPSCKPAGICVAVTTARPAGASSGRADRQNTARATLETVGADVGQVVGDHVQSCLLGIEAGTGDPERADHSGFLIGSSRVSAWPGIGIGGLQHLDLHFELPGQLKSG